MFSKNERLLEENMVWGTLNESFQDSISNGNVKDLNTSRILVFPELLSLLIY